jgi:16S rRNA (adenine1518-N6/adenine1519-N6)-dimethyltransferase
MMRQSLESIPHPGGLNNQAQKEAPLAGFRPNRSKGQNFLIQRRIAGRIAAMAELGSADDVIEIGPGLGILSEAVMECGIRSLTAIELDTRLAAALEARWRGRPEFRVIVSDFLRLGALPGDGPVKVVANLPFNIASAILERLCVYRHRIARMVLMFQREVAERIRAQVADKAYGALSLYTALYWHIDDHFRVSAGSFRPRPKVDAEVLVFTPRDPPPFAPDDEQLILRTIRAVFAAPRKTLRNSLASGLGLPPSRAAVFLEQARLSPDARAATLTLEDILHLAKVVKIADSISKDPALVTEATSEHPAGLAFDNA